MLNKMTWLPLALITLALSSCNQKAAENNDATMQGERSDKPVNVTVAQLASPKDLYCGMEVQEGGIIDTATINGKLYGFCSHGCKDSVVSNPGAYLTQK